MNSAPALMIVVCLVLTFTPPASAAHTLESTVAIDGININGLTDEWGDRPVVYLEESLRVVGVSHDADNLYLMFRFGDAQLAEQLLRRGVVLWINNEGKKKNKNDAFGIRYSGSEEIEKALEASRPACNDRVNTSNTHNNRGRENSAPPQGMADMHPKAGTLTVIRDGIKETVEGPDTRFQAASSAVDGVFAYELGIPLDEIGGKFIESSTTKTRKLAVGIQLGGLTEAEQELMKERMSQTRDRRAGASGGIGGPAGGMGGRGGGMGGPGGGGTSGRPGGSGSGRPNLDSDIDWLIVELPPAIG